MSLIKVLKMMMMVVQEEEHEEEDEEEAAEGSSRTSNSSNQSGAGAGRGTCKPEAFHQPRQLRSSKRRNPVLQGLTGSFQVLQDFITFKGGLPCSVRFCAQGFCTMYTGFGGSNKVSGVVLGIYIRIGAKRI